MKQLRRTLARLKRKLLTPPFLKDKRFPPYWLDKQFGGKPASIVQIGSNDGKTGDPLHTLLQKHQDWQALFVEPVPYVFEKLKKNYGAQARFRFENVAINQGETLTFYWVDSKAKQELADLPFWYDQLGSFDRTHITKHLDGVLEPYIISAQLEGITLPTLFKRNDIGKIDLLHIDTEGYDWKILAQLDLAKFQPSFILFEHEHLSQEELAAANVFFEKDYLLFEIGIDFFAVSKKLNAEVLRGIKSTMQLVKP